MSSVQAEARASLLTLPSELRNQIYLAVFDTTRVPLPELPARPDALALALQLESHAKDHDQCPSNRRSANNLRALATCKQIYNEAHLLAISLTPFHLSGEIAYPELFALRSTTLCATKLGAIRHLTLTARISHLRALNESWRGLPFGHRSLNLDTLIIVPKRPQVCNTAYTELADLSQRHTLAYVCCETLKSLRNVKCVELRNDNCFNEVTWRLCYRNLVYRMWRWGGEQCGIRFEEGNESDTHKQWFRAYLQGGDGYNEVGHEVRRLMGRSEGTADLDFTPIMP